MVAASPVFAQITNLAAWGLNGDGQTDIPVGLLPVSKLSAGGSHSLALLTNRQVVAWGGNSSGQCNVPASATNISAIAAGGTFSLALRTNGSLLAWGGTNSSAHLVPAGLATAIAAGRSGHAVAALTSGLIQSWGTTARGNSANTAPNLGSVKALAAGADHNVALLSDGTIQSWWATSSTFPPMPSSYVAITNVPTGLSNVIGISAGDYHTLALMSNGTVVAWGFNEAGQTNVPADLTNAVAIGTGGSLSLAVTTDGKVVTWGFSSVDPIDLSPRVAPGDLTNVVAVAGGASHVVALLTNPVPCVTQPPRSRSIPLGWPVAFNITSSGQAPLSYQWQLNGTNLPTQTNVSATISNVQSPDLGDYRVIVTNLYGVATSRMATLVAGPVLSWGRNGGEQCWVTPGFTNATALAGGGQSTYVIGSDGRVRFAGVTGSPSDPTNIQSIVDARVIASGTWSQVVLLSNRSVIALGSLNAQATVPPAASNISFTTTSGAGFEGFAVRDDGQLVCWATGPSQLTNVPPSMTNAVLAAAMNYALVLKNDGSAVAYGFGAPSIPASLSNVVALSVSRSGLGTPYALRADGSVVTWNSSGVMSAINGATNVVAMSVGTLHLLALRNDGTVFATGSTQFGQGTLPGTLSNVVEVAAGDYHSIVRFGHGTPRFTVDPYSRSLHAGSNTTLTAFGVGAQPLAYQWQFNGSDIPDATNANHILTNAALSSIGGYWCIISNSFGAVTSAVANVSVVFDPPRFNLLSPPASFGTNGFSVRIESLSGQGPLVVYASTNLVDWLPILTNPAGPTQFDFLDPEATNQPLRFYRASEQR